VIINVLAASTLESVINRYLDVVIQQYLDEEPDPYLNKLDGKVIALNLQGLGEIFYLVFNGHRVNVQGHLLGEADACITGTPFSLLSLRLQRQQDQRQSLFNGEVKISGDAELGRQVSALLDRLEIDWEEQLSRLIGDVAAHEIGSRCRSINDWARSSLATLLDDGREYLHEEAVLFVSHAELEPFLSNVDELRDDVERLSKRLERLEQQLGVSS
jgi:ubiquinone biosynthesis protein UbiJ